MILTVIHAAIIVNFAIEIVYASYMIFEVLKPPGGDGGPLYERALQIPHDLMVTRRLYATEAWIAITGLSLYVAITEIAPRMWLKGRRGGDGAG